MLILTNYINGRAEPPVGGRYLDDVEPATGRVFARVPDSSELDVQHAAEAAEAAFPKWSATPAAERCRMLLRLAELIEANLDRLARAESVDTGKPIRTAQTVDIPRAALNFRFFATAIVHFASECHDTDSVALNYTLRRPRGVVGAISPWNLPLYLFTWKIAPALACGNTVVGKPSELTPVTAHMLGELCQEAGLPPGVLNIVHGAGARAGAAIVAHPKISTITFTGGTVTGAAIAKEAAPLFKKLALELGGKNPTIIFADADMDRALPESLRAAFSNQGQICLCGSRILVEESAYPSFVERFVEAARALKVGDPLEEATQQGALVSEAHLDKVTSYVSLARHEGGQILCGGEPPGGLPERCREGYFLSPTVIVDLPPACRTNREEIFGPVVTITPFRDESEAISYANGVDYGLAATIWTRDLSRAHRVAAAVQSGIVWVNCWMLRDLRVPFGGMKASGVGREGGLEAMRFFTEPKNVCVKME